MKTCSYEVYLGKWLFARNIHKCLQTWSEKEFGDILSRNECISMKCLQTSTGVEFGDISFFSTINLIKCLQTFMRNEFGDISFFSKTKSMKCLQTSSQSEFGDIDIGKMIVGHNNPLCVSKLFVFLLCTSIPWRSKLS